MPSDRTAWIAAIAAAPDDDAVRLECADWFERQGDESGIARAEFIRIQIRRAGLPADDPAHSELEARELRLLKRWAPVWCGPHFVFRKSRFRRGFIEHVHLHMRHFQHHRRLMFAWEPVRDITLTGWNRAPTDAVRRLAACEEWNRVEALRIHHDGAHGMVKADVLMLLESPHLSRLKSLEITNVECGPEDRRRFQQLPLLRRLESLKLPSLRNRLHGPFVGYWLDDDGAEHADRWQHLHSLALPLVYFTKLRAFSELSFWNQLKRLEFHFAYSHHDNATAVLLQAIPSALEELRFEYASEFSSVEVFHKLGQLPLRTLEFSRNLHLSTERIHALFAGGLGSRLRELIAPDRIEKAHAEVLVQSGGLPQLESCDLIVDDAAAVVLFAADALGSPLRMSLRGIGDAGLAALAASRGCARLRSLDISGTELTEVGLRTLLASSALRNVTWLRLGGSTLSPECARQIVRLNHLVCVSVTGPSIPPESRRILEEGIAWTWFDSLKGGRERCDLFAPERWPPLDFAMKLRARYWWNW